ncbi:MAG: pyruvate, phosphate dikinase [Deltaproteobacteria bacterium]|nr:pyruvate, phosphate dikinase [Deltaproteobacteria bacterium]
MSRPGAVHDMLRDWLFHPLTALRELQQQRRSAQLSRLRARYQVFRTLLDDNHRAVELITELGASLRSQVFWPGALSSALHELLAVTADLVQKLDHLADGKYVGLIRRQSVLADAIRQDLARLPREERFPFCLSLDEGEAIMHRAVGGKAANLARLRQIGLFSVPAGFVIPVSVCRLFLDQENLYLRIVARLRAGEKPPDGLPDQESVDAVRQMIMATPLPAELASAMAAAAAPIFVQGKGLAVRSSAVGEDTLAHSFAGQYISVLNVKKADQLADAFRQVVASAFNVRNLAYRRHAGLPPYEFDLAILCLEMVDVYSAGILFTRDPNFGASNRMLITAVYGLGELAVGGSAAADVYHPFRDGSGPGESQVARKSRRLVSAGEGGVLEEELEAAAAEAPVLAVSEIMDMVRLGLAAEEQLGGPQDVEWAVDNQGKVVFLQSRPLKVKFGGPADGEGRLDRQPLLDPGQVASPGRGAGQVRIIGSRQDLQNMTSPPYVLVMHQSLVEAVSVLSQTAAILVDLGNPADHLSCVAREYEVPMLTGLQLASSRFRDGEQLLVDGERGLVFAATDQEITRHRELHLQKIAAWKDRSPRPDDPLAAALYDRVVPLNLTDAYGPTFSIAECRTIHDLVRYAHEKAVLAMFEAGDEAVEQAYGVIFHLESEVPFLVSLIDLGGGLLPGSERRVSPKQVLSRPFTALWDGVATPGLNWGPAGGVAVGSVVSRFLTDHRSARPIGLPNYALVTRDFLNLNARMDFHFTMVDAICGIDSRLNYIKFRFKGGGTSLEQRSRRVRCLAEILTATGFFCDLRDDLLAAAIQGGSAEVVEEKLRIIGRLLGFSRLLDAIMSRDELISRVARAFLDGDYQLAGLQEELQK